MESTDHLLQYTKSPGVGYDRAQLEPSIVNINPINPQCTRLHINSIVYVHMGTC